VQWVSLHVEEDQRYSVSIIFNPLHLEDVKYFAFLCNSMSEFGFTGKVMELKYSYVGIACLGFKTGRPIRITSDKKKACNCN